MDLFFVGYLHKFNITKLEQKYAVYKSALEE